MSEKERTMDRLTMTSDKGGLAFTFDLDFRSQPSEARKILALGERLKAYEDAEEQGLLVRLLPVDTHVFIIEDGEIFEFRVYQYSLLSTNNKNVRYWAECTSDENEDDLDFWQDEIGECVFLTREEAERKLKENTLKGVAIMIDCKDCKNHKGDCTLTPESSEECPNAIEVSIKWIDAELLSLYAAAKINGCEMTDDWRKAINALEISRKALREYLKENI